MAMQGTRTIQCSADAVKSGLRPVLCRLYAAFPILALPLFVATPASAQKSVPDANLVIAAPVANMFRSPSSESDVVSQAIYGTDVLSIQKKDAWYEIRTADDYTGWVSAADVRSLGSAGPYASDAAAVHVTALSANIYRDPSVTKHTPLLRLPWEARIESLPGQTGATGRWIQVKLVDGQAAWVQRGDVSAASTTLNIPEMLRLAHQFLGTTYTWGGVSTFGFDCSGFTQMLERQRGIEMPRDAGVQAAWKGVTEVKRAELQPGDLLFFGSSAAHITHTGIYIGNDEFIHDTTHDHPGVQISRLDGQPWTKLLVAARRIK